MTSSRSSRPATPIPWLSAVVLTVALVFSIYARQATEAVRAQGDEALAEAKAYFLEHPYLEPGPVLSARLDEGTIARARGDYEQRRRAKGWMGSPASIVRHQQGELAQRVTAALDDVAELPARAVAVVPGERVSAAWLGYPLLHPSSWQLVVNGLLLLLLGVYLERSLGRAGYAVLFVTVTLAGAASWKVLAPAQAEFGLVGAATPLAGLLGAFALRFARRADEGFYVTGMVLGALGLLLPPWAAAGWSTVQVGLVATVPAPAATAVCWAFLGAAGAGVLAVCAAWLLGADGEVPAEGASEVTRSPQFRRAMRARAAGRPREAMELLAGYLAAEPDAYEAALALYEVAAEQGRHADARAALLRVIRIELKRERAAATIDHWLDLTADGIPEKVDPALLIHMALLLREEGRREEAVRALRCALERSEDRASHVIAARIARAARGLDPGVVEDAAWRALGFVELGLDARQAIENLIAEAIATVRGRRGVAYAPAQERAAAAASHAQTPPGLLPDASPATPRAMTEPIAIDTDARVLDAIVAVPLELGEEGIEIQTLEGQKKLVRYERIEAVAVAAVHGLAPKPVILVDLVLNWMSPANETLRVIRLRGDRFDPRRLFPSGASSVDALRSFVNTLIERTGATALPDPAAASGRPFASFDDPGSYERVVLLVEGSAKKRV